MNREEIKSIVSIIVYWNKPQDCQRLSASMSSSSQSKQSLIVDETPSWDAIAYALRSVLCEVDIDLSRIGSTQRLEYEDVERIYYHLFLLINPRETRRKFRLVCAARNQEERNKFIESAVGFINDQQLHPQRVSSAQLRMFGGEPFRRLTASLIKAACEREMERHELSIEEQVELEQCNNDLGRLLDHLSEKMKSISSAEIRLKQSMEYLRELRERVKESNLAILDKKSCLSVKLVHAEARSSTPAPNIGHKSISGCSISGSSIGGGITYNHPNCQRDISLIVRTLLERLGDSLSRTKLAMDRIKSIELPREESLGPGETVKPKRLSQFIREVANKFNTSHEELKSEARQTRLNEQVRQQLIDYDRNMERLIEAWREEENRVDEGLLQMPDVRDMFDNLEGLIPKIQLTQIGPKGSAADVNVGDIEQILKDFPDPRYDDQEIIEITKKHFL